MRGLNPYPATVKPDVKSLADAVQKIGNIRQNDQTLWNALPSTFVAGRTTVRIPSSSTDVLVTDAVGDQVITDTFAYYLINASGTIEWVRVATGTF